MSGIAFDHARRAGPEAFFDELHDTAPAAAGSDSSNKGSFIFRIIWL